MAGLRVAEAGARQVGFEDGRRGVSRSVGHRPGFQHQGSAATRKSRAVAAPRSARFPREQLSVQVESLRFFIKRGYGWRYRVKRSRWPGFVESTPNDPLGTGGTDHFGSLRSVTTATLAGPFKTMPVYGAESRTPNHTQLKQIKTAGSRFVYFRKMPVWSAYANLAP